jgi:two-component system response regulator AlgR
VDDETPARNRLRALLADLNSIYTVLEAKNGRDAITIAEQNPINTVLLDIRMPEMDGLETAQHLNKISPAPAIIFTTAYDAHALQAFDLNAIDYLLKPVRAERLELALAKARSLKTSQITALQPLTNVPKHISINERGRVLLIPVEKIVYFRAELKYITVRTIEKEYLLEDSLTRLEAVFTQQFVRCHRNCIVAKQYIQGFEKRLPLTSSMEEDSQNAKEKQWVVLLKGLNEVVPVSRRQQHIIKEAVDA